MFMESTSAKRMNEGSIPINFRTGNARPKPLLLERAYDYLFNTQK